MVSADWSSAQVWIELDGQQAELHPPDRSFNDHPQAEHRLRWLQAHENAALAIGVRLPPIFSQSDYDILHFDLTFNDSVTYTWTVELHSVMNMSNRAPGYLVHNLFVFRDRESVCGRVHMRLKLGTGIFPLLSVLYHDLVLTEPRRNQFTSSGFLILRSS